MEILHSIWKSILFHAHPQIFFGGSKYAWPLFFTLWVGVIFSLLSHEYAHAKKALALGDATPLFCRRARVDPKSLMNNFHPLGLTCFVITYLLVGIPIGWLRPVPIDVENNRDLAKVALAGPLANFVLVFIFATSYVLFRHAHPSLALTFMILAKVNFTLAVINLIPAPMCDGHKIFQAIPALREGIGAAALAFFGITGIVLFVFRNFF